MILSSLLEMTLKRGLVCRFADKKAFGIVGPQKHKLFIGGHLLPPIRLSRVAFYDGATFFTAVSDSCPLRRCYLLKVIPSLATCLKTFRAPPFFQFIDRDCQMAVSTAHPVIVFGEQYELTVSAGIHGDKSDPPLECICLTFVPQICQRLIPR